MAIVFGAVTPLAGEDIHVGIDVHAYADGDINFARLDLTNLPCHQRLRRFPARIVAYNVSNGGTAVLTEKIVVFTWTSPPNGELGASIKFAYNGVSD